MRYFGALKKVLAWFWRSLGGIYIRKIINTFRPVASILGKLQGGPGRRKRDALIWTHEDHYKADFYSDLNADGTAFVDYVCKHVKNRESVLDICCNQGRFLLELRRRGFTELYGFDIMEPALRKLRQSEDYDPDLIRAEHCLAQEYFLNKDGNVFDWAITYSATIELIHPEFDIFGELGRTVKKGMFLVLNENGHSYPRFYRLLHRMNGFRIVAIKKSMGGCVLIHSVKKVEFRESNSQVTGQSVAQVPAASNTSGCNAPPIFQADWLVKNKTLPVQI